MSGGRFILALLLLAAAGAGAGYGAAQLVPADVEERTPPIADFTPPGAGEAGSPSMTLDDLPPEVREAMANDPEMAAAMREAMETGLLSTGEFGPPPEAGTAGMIMEEGSARNATPLAGTVVSFEGGTLRLETPDGEAAIAVADDVTVNVTKAVSDAGTYLVEGAKVSVVARPDDSGGLAAAAVIVGGAGQGAGGGRGFGGLAAVVMGTVASFADGVLTLETADGPAEFALADDTPVRITTTAAEAASELAAGVTVTAFVQREADGSLSAASVNVGEGGGGFGRGQFGGGQGGGQRGGAGGGESGG